MHTSPDADLEAQARDPGRVMPGLFVGERRHIYDDELLDRLGITHVLSLIGCAAPLVGRTHTLVVTSDFGTSDLLGDILPRSFAFIDAARAAGGSVLVHCQGGANRAPTVSIAYLMHQGWSLRRAYRRVLSVRPQTCPHEAYFALLQAYERALTDRPPTLSRVDLGPSLQDVVRALRRGDDRRAQRMVDRAKAAAAALLAEDEPLPG